MTELSLVTLNLELAIASLTDCENRLSELQKLLGKLSNNMQELREAVNNGQTQT